MTPTIACPDCNTPIAVNTDLLLQGTSFTCVGCGLKLSLSPKSRQLSQHAVSEIRNIQSLAKQSITQ